MQEFRFLKLAHFGSCLRALLQKIFSNCTQTGFLASHSYFALTFHTFLKILVRLRLLPHHRLFVYIFKFEDELVVAYMKRFHKFFLSSSSSASEPFFLLFIHYCETRSFSFLLYTISVYGLLLVSSFSSSPLGFSNLLFYFLCSIFSSFQSKGHLFLERLCNIMT